MLEVIDIVRAAREATGAPTLTRESVDAANAAAEAAKNAENAGDSDPAPGAVADTLADTSAAQVAADASSAEGEKAKPIEFKAAYVSDDGVIYLVGAYAGNIDLDDEILQTKALVAMSYDFTSSPKRTFKANHKDEIAADLVASMPGAPILKSGRVLKYGEDMPENDPMVGIDLKAEPICWVLGIRPHDKSIADKAKAGDIVGASWGAFVDKIDL